MMGVCLPREVLIPQEEIHGAKLYSMSQYTLLPRKDEEEDYL
jgi:hypothetical protein